MFSYSRYYQGPNTNHYDGTRFYNPWNLRHTSFLDVLKWKWNGRSKRWPKCVKNTYYDVPPMRMLGDELRVTFIGHSTVLIQTQGINILTDPIWSASAAPFKLGIRRVSPPGLDFSDIPQIDLVLVSHNHYDHLDLETLRMLYERDAPLVITPLGNDKIIQKFAPASFLSIVTLDWDQFIVVNEKVKIHLLPAQHWSARGIFDRDRALWGAFVIETTGGNIYFAGDTGYAQQAVFQYAKQKFNTFRLALLPVGAYEPRWFMRYAHMNPEEAVRACIDLGQPTTMAIHLQTFKLTDEGYDDQIKDLNDALDRHKLEPNQFRALRIGEGWDIP